jgi:glutamyl-tRNA reductase
MTTDAIESIEPTDDTVPASSTGRDERQCAEAVVAAIHRDAERIKRREVKEAIGRLEAHGDLGETERDAVEEMADSIVEGFLAGATDGLRATPDWPAVRAALRLFEPDFGTDEAGSRANGSARSEGRQ